MSDVDKPVINPASPGTIFLFGCLFLVLAILLFYLLITAWPVLETSTVDGKEVPTGFKSFRILGFFCDWAPDRQMLFMVMTAGAVGSLAHALTSFGTYVGNRELSNDWIWFIVLRIPIGVALAVLFYFIVRGGLLLPTVQSQPPAANSYQSTLLLNPFGIAAFSALAGMFSKQATDKLGEIFNAVFSMKAPVERQGALGSSKPLKVNPPKLTAGNAQDLIVTGTGFDAKTEVTINGQKRTFTKTSETEGKIAVLPDDVRTEGSLKLVIKNPNGDAFEGEVAVVKPGTEDQAPKLKISDTDPKVLSKASKSLTVIGEGFRDDSTATVNGDLRKPAFVSDRTITIALQDKDVAGTEVKLVVKNPGDTGAGADRTIKVN